VVAVVVQPQIRLHHLPHQDGKVYQEELAEAEQFWSLILEIREASAENWYIRQAPTPYMFFIIPVFI
jgi:hypothetical protein